VSFRLATTRDDLWIGEMKGVIVDGVPVLLINLEDGVHAYEDVCRHQGVRLSGGRLSGTKLVCPVHAWEYDAASGRGLNPSQVCLPTFPVRVVGNEIQVDVDATSLTAVERRDRSGAPANDDVGPVLQAVPLGTAIVEALRALNPDARVVDRGAYLRVLCIRRCVLTRAAVEERTGAPFRLPGDLELVMSSFKGRLTVSDEEARWELSSPRSARGATGAAEG
jgi:toluene monooxygenase system ferredoxin subunit